MINPRNDKKELDEEMKRIIYSLRKKYKFPYSHGHIKDRANHYDEKYREEVKADFAFFESITNSFCLARCDELNRFVMIKKPIMDFFDEEIKKEKTRRGFNSQYFLNPEATFRVDMSKINKDHKWEEENNLVKTNYLVGKTIKGFEIENNEKPLYEDIKIELEVIKEEGTIINTAKTESLENEKDINNNEDEEKAKIIKDETKTFDLSMQKYLYSIDEEKLTNKEIVAKNIEGKIEYTKNNEICKVANNQKLVFTLRIFNEGEKQTLGRDVYEYIPEGLEFITDSTINKENEWKMYKQDKAGNLVEVENIKDATVLKTDKLRNEQIDGFDINNNELPKYKDIQIEFKVNENKVKDENRVITNIAKIESTRLEKNQENDKSEEKVQVKQFDLELVKYIKEIKIKDDLGDCNQSWTRKKRSNI